MKFNIYQVSLTDAEVQAVNSADNPFDIPKYKAYIDATIGDYRAAMDADFYEFVAQIDADDLNGVFHIGNMGPESAITRVPNTQMTSVSVGNIIENRDEGGKHVVMPVGFEEVQ